MKGSMQSANGLQGIALDAFRDYPVRNTAYVGIIVCSGLEHTEGWRSRTSGRIICLRREETSRHQRISRGTIGAFLLRFSPDEAGYTGDETMMEKDDDRYAGWCGHQAKR